MTKVVPSAQDGHHRTPHGISDRHSDPLFFANKVETSRWKMAQFREIVSKTYTSAVGVPFFALAGVSLTASMFECHVRFERNVGILLKYSSKIVDIGSCRYITPRASGLSSLASIVGPRL